MRQNTGATYCDSEFNSYVGIMRHNLDLKCGAFEFGDGRKVNYWLN